jgi:hypothetical protein
MDRSTPAHWIEWVAGVLDGATTYFRVRPASSTAWKKTRLKGERFQPVAGSEGITDVHVVGVNEQGVRSGRGSIIAFPRLEA